MTDITFHQKVKVIYGDGAVRSAGAVVRAMGGSRALVVFDDGVRGAGLLGKLTAALDGAGVAYVLFGRVEPDPPAHLVDEGARLCREAGCDAVIGLGGGSSLDTAKGINLLRFNRGPILALAYAEQPPARSPGLLSVPTTAGTGSETSDGLIITDTETGTKVPILAVDGMSEYALVDPGLMAGMPPVLTAHTGLDVLAHLCETATTVRRSPFTLPLAEAMAARVVAWLPVAVRDGAHREARAQMAIASTMAGCLLANHGAHVGHSIAHVLGARFHIPHGAACAYAEPWVLAFNAPAVPEETRRLGTLLGASFTGRESPKEIGAKTRDAYRAFGARLGLRPLARYLPESPDIAALAAAVAAEPFATLNPRPVGEPEAAGLLEAIWCDAKNGSGATL
ncbi:MAG: iron-containing alcohol dehydrogenase [Oscillospiraceae bacterium]|jgi:alcohol dehydrogenase class IV|nr:iron-containing alcohol dehydrogenase [Oscillospiraceae bacterium]